MSKSAKKSIEKASEIIQAFGGIRPMASKINVAVTTVQGWKKRDVIPAARKALILEAAQEHKIDLSSFFDDAPAVSVEEPVDEVVVEEPAEEKPEVEADDTVVEIVEVIASRPEVEDVASVEDNVEDVVAENTKYTELVVEPTDRSVSKNAMIAAGLVFVVALAALLTVLPNFGSKDAETIEVAAVDPEIIDVNVPTGFKGLVSEDWSEQLAHLKQQVEDTKVAAGDAIASVQVAGNEFIENQGLEARVEQLQTYVSEITGKNGVYSLLSRFDTMRGSSSGQSALDSSVGDLLSAYKSSGGGLANDPAGINAFLDQARSASPSLGQTFSGVPKNELKAAAALFAMTQVRSALNRKDEAFDEDLSLLMNMVDEDDVDFRSSLEKLAPHSRAGVFSAGGLRQEYQTVAGEADAAYLRGVEV